MTLRLPTSFIFMLFLLLSCTMGGRQVSELERRAERLLASNPDSAIKVVDSALRTAGGMGVSEAAQIRLLLTRQQAFAARRQMDSVIKTGVRIRRLALLEGDSLSIAKSLLPVRGEVSLEDQRGLEPYLAGAARVFAAKGMRYEEAVIEGLTGAIATRKAQYAESMKHLYRARDIHEGLDSVKPLFAVYMNIGNNLSGMGDLRGSLVFYEKAAQVARRLNDSIRIATALMNKGVVRSDLRDFDSSRLRLNEALTSLPAAGGEYARMQIDYNLATVSLREGDLAAAETAFRKLVDQANAMGDPFAVGMANSGLAGVLGRTGRVEEAIRIMEATLRQQEAMGLGYYTIEHTQKIVTLYKQAGRYPEALAASERLKAMSDSLLGADKQRTVQELEARYNFSLQEEKENDLRQQLRQRNRLSASLAFTVLGLLSLGVVMRQRNRYQRDLTASYRRLLEEYRLKRDDPAAAAPPANFLSREGAEDEYEGGPPVEVAGTDLDSGDGVTESDRLLYERVRAHFAAEKPHLNPDLKVDDVAKRLDVSPRRLSQVLKSASGRGFIDFVNGYRIEEATRAMDSDGSESLKLETIALRCGFNSRQQFRRVFEQVTGVNPGFYRSSSSDRGQG